MPSWYIVLLQNGPHWIRILADFFSFVPKQGCEHVKWLSGSSGTTENLNAYLNFIWTILSFLGFVKLELKSHGNWLSQESFGEPEILWEQPFPWCFASFYFGFRENQEVQRWMRLKNNGIVTDLFFFFLVLQKSSVQNCFRNISNHS